MRQGLSITALLIASVLASILALGLAYRAELRPQKAWAAFEGVSPSDGWVSQDGKIYLPYLAARGNTLHLRFSSFRPQGMETPLVLGWWCDQKLLEIALQADSPEVSIPLRGSCVDQHFRLQAKNPYVPSNEGHHVQDRRALVAQLEFAQVSSKLGFPLLAPELIALFSTLFFIAGLGTFLLYRSLGITCAVFLLSFLLIALQRDIHLTQMLVLQSFLIFPLWGARVLLSEGVREEKRGGKEWRASLLRFLLPVILVLAFVLRLSGLSFGLPANFHPDEIPKVNVLESMQARDSWNPLYFKHPSGLLYISYVVSELVQLFDTVLVGTGLDARTRFALSGRIVSLLAGVLSVFLLFLIGKRLFGAREGLLAAFLLAVFPLHVTVSRYMKEDALLLAAMLFVFYLLLRFYEKPSLAHFFLSAVSLGLCISVKYTGLLAVIFFPLLYFYAPFSSRRAKNPPLPWLYMFFLFPAGILLGFLVLTPYSLLDTQNFLKDVYYETRHASGGHSGALSAWTLWWTYHFRFSVLLAVAVLPAFIFLVVAGKFLQEWRKPLGLCIFLVFFFYVIAEIVPSKPFPQAERYIVPLLPWLALALSAWIFRLQQRRLLLALFCALPPLFFSICLQKDMHADTRHRMADWMQQHIPSQARIMIDWPAYGPPLPASFVAVEYFPVNKVSTRLSREWLTQEGVHYLVLSSFWYDRYLSQPRADVPVMRKFQKLFSELELLHEEKPFVMSYGFHSPGLRLYRVQEFAQ